MTREKAIYNLKALLTMCDFRDAYGYSVCAEPYYEAVDMAIEALADLQPTCNQLATDCISRQDFDKFLEDAEKEAVKNRKYVFASALNTIRGNLKIFPSAQPKIIRCRDCKHWDGVDTCDVIDAPVWDNDFCSMAERRNDE